jgi:hypothetical protein
VSAHSGALFDPAAAFAAVFVWLRACADLCVRRLSGVVRFKVQYDEYGNQETVDAYAVRARAAGAAKAGGAVKKKKVGEKVVEQEDEADGDDGPKIPEHLKILPGDSDKVHVLSLVLLFGE